MSLASVGLQYTRQQRARRGTGDALCLGAPDEKQRRPLPLASAGARRAARVKDMLACVGVLAGALVAFLHVLIVYDMHALCIHGLGTLAVAKSLVPTDVNVNVNVCREARPQSSSPAACNALSSHLLPLQ